ncbi:MAG: glycosyltransferase [Microthrixaceae bacterium]
MRSLVVAELYPWPAVDGYRQRLTQMIGGLAAAGEVDVFTLDRPGSPPPEAAPWPGVARTRAVAVPGERGTRDWLGEWVRGDLPRRLLSVDWTAALAELDDWARGPYDLVWYSHVDTWWPVHTRFGDTPAVVDFDNLEHLALRLRRRIPPRYAPGADAAARARVAGRWAVSRGFDLVDERRWDAVQRRCAEQVDHVVVCSDLDADRSGVANAVVVPNGCEPPSAPRVDRTVVRGGGAPVLGFVGALDYEPNTEAVEWFVREVFPIVRTHRPDARFRVVGRGAELVEWVRGEAGVELVGRVPDLRAELDLTDVSVVPIRVGAGTRLKVVEALAHHLPLVTTTVGCEGIDVVDGATALVADDARGFADACLRLLGDGALRQRLADAGADLFGERYTWAGIRGRVTELARATAG